MARGGLRPERRAQLLPRRRAAGASRRPAFALTLAALLHPAWGELLAGCAERLARAEAPLDRMRAASADPRRS